MPLLVWLESPTGFQMQIWHTDQLTGEGKRRIHPVAEIKITEAEASLGIDLLKERYSER